MKYLKYLFLITSVVDDVAGSIKRVKKAEPSESSAPLSINGVMGDLYVGWRPRAKE